MIPYGRQDISEQDIQQVIEVLKSDFLTQGPQVPLFEKAIAQYVNAQHGVAVNSATSALHIACLALGLGPGDSLWTTPTTFVASANCAIYCGADVDFVDIDPRTYNMSIECLTDKLAQAEKQGKLPKIVVPVHLCGQPCDMKAIRKLSRQYGFKVIEDASHAIGAQYKGKPVGNCEYSEITVFSFHPVKIITTGEGGLATTNCPELAERMRLRRSHGISSCKDEMKPRPEHEIWNYQQIAIGFNYRITEMQAALGRSQLQRLDEFVEKRHAIAKAYNEDLRNLDLQLPWQDPDGYSSYHLYPIRVKSGAQRPSQKALYGRLFEEGIAVNLHYIPVYRQPFYEAKGFKEGYCPESEKYFREAISIPVYPNLGEEQYAHVVRTLRTALASGKV